ncbi:hypothetical protein NLX67_10375 [Domibacillus sp. A3M-37]|uniref:hypothetical protein n=1 Tax=Domibacillus sp. A3M-37 TaxID=2962037 RepID=UPI0020B6A102|nr:hypothetical protein [Domibacillus sp. A3M-37]MCP3762795.1 hypothetical protein [Domibacillus sp. A3M-37]
MKIQFGALGASVNAKRPAVNARLYAMKSGGSTVKRSRMRSSRGESDALTALILAKKKRAVQEGTFMIKEPGKIYFDAY